MVWCGSAGASARPSVGFGGWVGRDGWVRLWTIPDLGMLDAVELGVPLDGLGGTQDALLVGDRRGGVHFLDVGG